MTSIKLIIEILTAALGCLAALASIMIFLRLRWPAPFLWVLKLFASALSPLFALIGVLCIILGITTDSALISLIGIYDAIIFLVHIFRVTRPPDFSSGFEKVFGSHWENTINAAQKNNFLPRRTVLRLPAVPSSRLERNVPFSTIAGTSRKLLCDVWQPSESVSPSGLAFIYLHGSAWYLLDKDVGTRPFFNHLASQGHVIMDVAYRLAPETDMMGMVNDLKRAIIWMKENAGAYGVNPNRVVVGGGSAGGQLAMLAAYTANNPVFTANELQGKDISVCAVISMYGPTDLKAQYYHLSQHLTTRSVPGRPKKAVATQMPEWMVKRMGKEYYRLNLDKGFAGTFATLFGGHPDECPETYALFSPLSNVHAGCPPTLLIHGEHDVMAPVRTTRFLHARLVEEKVPAVMHILPQTDHAFDLAFPKISPSAHNAFYDVERFLALMSDKTIAENETIAQQHPIAAPL